MCWPCLRGGPKREGGLESSLIIPFPEEQAVRGRREGPRGTPPAEGQLVDPGRQAGRDGGCSISPGEVRGARWGWKEALGGGGAPEATPHPRGSGQGPGRHRAAYRAGAGPQAEDAGLADVEPAAPSPPWLAAPPPPPTRRPPWGFWIPSGVTAVRLGHNEAGRGQWVTSSGPDVRKSPDRNDPTHEFETRFPK